MRRGAEIIKLYVTGGHGNVNTAIREFSRDELEIVKTGLPLCAVNIPLNAPNFAEEVQNVIKTQRTPLIAIRFRLFRFSIVWRALQQAARIWW